MRRFLSVCTCIVSCLSYALPAYATEATLLRVSRVGDIELSCGQLSQEAVLMRDIISTTEEIKDDASLRSYGVTAAGALGSLLVSSVTGGVGIAAAGYLLKHTTDEESDEADGVQDLAAQRRSLMVGIYNAKECHGPIEHAFNSFYDFERLAEGKSAPVELAGIEPAAGDGGWRVDSPDDFNQ